MTISGFEGGTGASPLDLAHPCRSPWEIGLSETQQTLVLNGLRGRIAVQVDGGLRTGRDVAIGALLGADEFGFATAPLIASGCIMMRKCHLNTCPVGVATQDPVLRARFTGQPEHVINYFFFVAEELREIMAKLGLRTLNEMIGRVDLLDMRKALQHWKAKGVDLSKILYQVPPAPGVATWNCERQNHGLEAALDHDLIKAAKPAIESGQAVSLKRTIRNVDRTIGAMLSGEIARRHGHAGLPEDTISVRFTAQRGKASAHFWRAGFVLIWSATAMTMSARGFRAVALSCDSQRTPGAIRPRTSLSATLCSTARLRVKLISKAWRANALACAIPARSRWSKGPAITAANI